ncbi:MBOAT family O-acyltransferase [Virgibacillus oceani]|uniref:Alginate O-acetylation protein n=1 Tax=Virgibacillus oceani TaxID=1479511 RepID=A0A917HBE6_9BACI|nr:MBOAT family protein [Virgibacillus oceani]GGG73211.1 alginate O-acetylation protein [Virgibacillus oceani]
MVFSSSVFLFLFLPVVFVLYFISPRKFKNTVLLGASLFFYAWGEPKFVLLMLVSILINYIFGLIVDLNRENKSKAKMIIGLMVVSNLLLLGFFKYANFLVDNINYLFNISISIPDIPLPIGISFFTFQAMSYVIDVYRKDGKVQKNPLNLALYISLFPQLIAGPIVRYQTVADQITKRISNFERISYGVKRFIIGLGKKVLIANNCGYVADQIFNMQPSEMSAGVAWIGIIAYTLQIYFDFSGYSDMAIGLGKILGFDFLENFNFPYFSRSISEFWRRWHISLGSWFRDYVYIPLGGNRAGRFNTYRNLFIVWLATGIWHGASWTFIAWGLYYGVFIMLEKAFLGKVLKQLPKFIQHIYTLLIVIIGWVFFRSETFSYAFSYIQVMFAFNGKGLWDSQAVFYTSQHGIILLIGIIGSMPVLKAIAQWINAKSIESKAVYIVGKQFSMNVYVLGVFFLSLVYLISSTFNPFIYFRF